MEEDFTIQDTVEVFIGRVLPQIIDNEDVPAIRFVFSEDSYSSFQHIFAQKWGDDAASRLINQIRSLDGDYPMIYVEDSASFIALLHDIALENTRLYAFYGEHHTIRNYAFYLFSRIFLRMHSFDFDYPLAFLERQLSFLQDDTFDSYHFRHKVAKLGENDVFCKTAVGRTWDEATRQMQFWVENEERDIYSLPRVHYDITTENDEKVCYLLGVQNEVNRKKMDGVNKYLRRLNHGIESCHVPQNKVYSLLLFFDLLKEVGITTIRVPLLQVLSYDYHVNLSNYWEYEFHRLWPEDRVAFLSSLTGYRGEREMQRYRNDKKSYDRFVNKQDLISKIKTEDLYQLMFRMMQHIPELALMNDLDNNLGTLDFRLSNKVKKISK